MGQVCVRCSATLPERARFCPECAYEQSLGAPSLSETVLSSKRAHDGHDGHDGHDAHDASVARPRASLAPPRRSRPADAVRRSPVPPAPAESPTMLDGAPVALTHLLAAGTVVSGVYTIEQLIGTGGMGAVYRAHDHARARAVAIKVIHPNLASDLEIRRRFAREAELMRSLIHAHVVAVFDFIQEDNFLAIVMEHVDGPTLSREIARWDGHMPYAEIRAIMSAILSAMDAAHQRGIVHRDLKPDNVLLRMDQQQPVPKVVDFGVAKILEGTTYTVTGAMLGTCKYMAPEQVERPHLLGYPADVYSLGVTLFEMVTGRCPFDYDSHFALMMAHVREAPVSPATLRADVPKPLVELIMQALSKQPEQRPRDCREFHDRLISALDGFDSAQITPADAPANVRDADGGELLLVPAGFFGMGQERRSVYLDAFYIDRFPVTNQQFAKFLSVTDYKPTHKDFMAQFPDARLPPELALHPAVHVSWFDARAYAQWAGKTLPSEAQWEKAARGTDGRKYPWGKSAPDATRANYGLTRRGTVPVGTFPAGASPYGVEDLAGNVWEWCEDLDAQDFYAHGPSHNPCNHGDLSARGRRVVRGGSFMYDAHSVRTFSRSSFEPQLGSQGIGFRCVRRV